MTFFIILGIAVVLYITVRIISYREMIKDIEAEITERMRPVFVKLEKHGDIVYAFTEENDQFVGQGATKKELIESMRHNIRGKNVSATRSELQKVGFDVK